VCLLSVGEMKLSPFLEGDLEKEKTKFRQKLDNQSKKYTNLGDVLNTSNFYLIQNTLFTDAQICNRELHAHFARVKHSQELTNMPP
jgi:hypothetical protein